LSRRNRRLTTAGSQIADFAAAVAVLVYGRYRPRGARRVGGQAVVVLLDLVLGSVQPGSPKRFTDPG
jgi:hypothetical protein